MEVELCVCHNGFRQGCSSSRHCAHAHGTAREERFRRAPLIAGCFSIGVGFLSLYSGFNRPTIANMRTVDLVLLIGTGVSLGVGLVGVIIYFVHRRKD